MMKAKLFYLIAGLIWAKSAFGTTLPSGLWQIDCKNGLIKEQVVRGDSVVFTEKFYAAHECQQISFIFETSGQVAFTPEHDEWIDFTFERVSLTVFNPEAVQVLNRRKVCSSNDWVVGEPKEITGHWCALFNINKETQIPNTGDLKYGIFKIKENRLFYGQMTKELDGSTPSKRPNVLDFQFYSLKK